MKRRPPPEFFFFIKAGLIPAGWVTHEESGSKEVPQGRVRVDKWELRGLHGRAEGGVGKGTGRPAGAPRPAAGRVGYKIVLVA